MRAIFTVMLSIPINIPLLPLTKAFWSGFVHQPLLEQAIDAELAYRIALHALDLLVAAALMAGIGLVLAALCVQLVAKALSRR